MARALGVDLGSRRIGLALSDPTGSMASPLAVVERSGDRVADHEAVVDAALSRGADVVVVGLPLTLGGELGPAARRVLSEVDELRGMAGERLRVEVHDERLSTVTADRSMREASGRGRWHRRRRREVDQVAAAVILQSWLDGRDGLRTHE